MLASLLRTKLQELASETVLFDSPLSQYTSFGMGGPADAVVFLRTAEEAGRIVSFLTAEGVPFIPLGNGTNLIVRDGGYRGVVLCLRKLIRLEVREGGTGKYFHAEAGVSLAELASRSLCEGLGGLEFCTGIPGSVGGAVRMNAGAYGREMKDVVTAVTFLTKAGAREKQKREELMFNYRHLAVPVDFIILAADFSLLPAEREEIRTRIENNLGRRRARHPLQHRNAGSIFKNPAGLPAGRLVEELGLKGLQVGEAKISEQHGNFIVNLGRARAADVLSLIDLVREKAWQERGIVLETEVHIIGEEA